jgi:hypothetical protein
MENGEDITSIQQTTYVWTGTSEVGVYSGAACDAGQGATSSWNVSLSAGTYGDATAMTQAAVQTSSLRCPNAFHLYCLGVDRKAVLQ